MELVKLEHLLSHDVDLLKIFNEANRVRTLVGKSIIALSVLKTEYEIAVEVEKAKVAGNTATMQTKLQELIAHQTQHDL